jgi:hypothetical protein
MQYRPSDSTSLPHLPPEIWLSILLWIQPHYLPTDSYWTHASSAPHHEAWINVTSLITSYSSEKAVLGAASALKKAKSSPGLVASQNTSVVLNHPAGGIQLNGDGHGWEPRRRQRAFHPIVSVSPTRSNGSIPFLILFGSLNKFLRSGLLLCCTYLKVIHTLTKRWHLFDRQISLLHPFWSLSAWHLLLPMPPESSTHQNVPIDFLKTIASEPSRRQRVNNMHFDLQKMGRSITPSALIYWMSLFDPKNVKQLVLDTGYAFMIKSNLSCVSN